VPFQGAIVASEIGSYKPAPGHWRAFYETTGATKDRHVHVAQSHFHDIVPANELGIRSIWINRLGGRGEPAPTRELSSLEGLADALDELIPSIDDRAGAPSGPEAAEAQRVGDDAEAGEGHRGRGDDGIEQPTGGQG
jgi:hypothetical protein